MRKLEALLEAKLEAVLDKVVADVIDRALVNAIDRVISKTLGVDPAPTAEVAEPAPKAKGKAKGKARKTRAEVAEPTPTAEVATPTPTAEVATPTPKAEVAEPEDELLARLERVAESLGERYGPMLLRRARSITKHALNPHGAVAVIVSWAETTEPAEVIATLRGSEKLPDGTTLSGWRLMAAKLGIPWA